MAKQTIKVLLVEDNPGDIRLLQELLREVTTTMFKLTSVERLDEALKCSEEESFDIVLLDLSLPDSQGLETFVKIHHQVPAIPIVVLTGLDDETLATKAVHAGAQDYLVKGQVSGNLLLRSMRYAIERQQAEEAVRQSNERLMLALDAAHTGTWDWNMVTNEVLWTPYHEILFGYEPGTPKRTYTDWSSRVHPQDLAHVEACIQAAMTWHQDFQSDYRIILPDGSIRWINAFGRFHYNSSGQAYRMVGVVNDITKRKQAEEGLRQSEERWQLALKGNNDGIWDQDLRTDKHFLSTKCLEILGYSELELNDFYQDFHKWVELIHPEDQKGMMNAFQAHLQHQTPYYVAEYRMLASDGTYKWILSRGQALWDEAGNPVRAVGSITDITERKLAEEKILEQAALLNVATDAIFMQNWSNQQIVFWNKGAERLYGWTEEEALEQDVNKLLCKPSPQLEAALKTVAECGSWQGELHQVTRTDRKIIVQSRWTLVRDGAGQPKSILVVNTDITQKKQLEAQFLRAQRLESIGTLAGGIAHDINNLLAPMLMSAQLLQMKISDQRSQHLLQTIESNAKRGGALVKQVLSFTRGIEGNRTTLQIRHLVLEIEQIVKATFPKFLELHVNIAPDLSTVSADATQLHQVLMNLVVNARDAMPDGGTLSIKAENLMIDEQYAGMNINAQTGSYIALSVTDTGCGMPPEILERIFEPFFTTKEVGKGTGLGLSTVIGIIKSHGGFVNVYSEVGRGTTFKVYLPVMEEAETQPLSPALELPQGNGELVLLVDDEAAIREITRSSLETHNYRVITASDGIEALATYAQHQQEINLVLMDMMMPSMDGTIASRTLQKINPSVKIIATSGLACNEKIVEASSIGIKAFLSKPYTVKELLQTINKVKAEY